ncbi:20139_t:CDS:2, partial [Racocetra fulgida]
LNNLDFKRTYTFEEFELVNEQLKTRTLKIDGNPVDLFEFNKGKLLPMPQNPINKEASGFDFDVSVQRTIRAPDVAFIPKNIYQGYQEFEDLDRKFREIYFATSSSVDL